MNDPEQYLKKAKASVNKLSAIEVDQLYVVWFAKTLDNWKALISTDKISGQYWEVTYNGNKRETYVDHYTKNMNAVLPDE